MIDAIYDILNTHFALYSYKDFIELIMLTTILYQGLRWFARDTTKPLAHAVLLLAALITLSSIFHLSIINTFIWWFAPTILTLLVIIHQEQLQRNFVTYRAITTRRVNNVSEKWLNTLLQYALRLANTNKAMMVIIEQNDSLEPFINMPFTLDVPITDALLTVLLENEQYNDQQFIIVNQQGQLKSINSSWALSIDPTWFRDEWSTITLKSYEHKTMLAYTLYMTSKSDALAYWSLPHAGTALIAQGKIVEHMTAKQALRILKHYLHDVENQKGDKNNEPPGYAQRNRFKQPHA